jgi:hypothetical protein
MCEIFERRPLGDLRDRISPGFSRAFDIRGDANPLILEDPTATDEELAKRFIDRNPSIFQQMMLFVSKSLDEIGAFQVPNDGVRQ